MLRNTKRKRVRVRTPMKRPAAEGLSVTELAAQAGVSPRAVRYYVARGVLPTPKFQGRRTRYGREHVVRLFAVLAMRKERLDLDAIRRRLTTLTSEELEAYVPSPAARPAAGATLVPPPTANYAGASWEHVALLPGVELHIRSDASPAVRKVVQEIVDHCVGGRLPEFGAPSFSCD